MAGVTRRQHRHQTTIDEIKQRARAQMEEGGPASLSLNAIARDLGMTGPALYRYVAGRDELLTMLIVEGYLDLADTVDAAIDSCPSSDPDGRLRAHGRAFRAWAHIEPSRYALLFGTPVPGYQAPAEQTTPAAQRGTRSLLRTLGPMAAAAHGPRPRLPRALGTALRSWAAGSGEGDVDARAVELATVCWTRVHGFVSLEIQGHFDALVDGHDELFERELDALVALVHERLGLG